MRFCTSADWRLPRRHLDDHVPGVKPFLGRGRIRVHLDDHHALHAILDLVLLAQLVAHVGEVEASAFCTTGLSGAGTSVFTEAFIVLPPSPPNFFLTYFVQVGLALYL